MKKNYLRMIAAVTAMLLALVFAFAGCGEGKEAGKGDDSGKNDGTATPAPETGAVSLEMAQDKPIEFLETVFEKTLDTSGTKLDALEKKLASKGGIEISVVGTGDYAGNDGTVAIYYSEDGKVVVIADAALAEMDIDASLWLTKDGVIVSSEAAGAAPAKITDEYIASLIEELEFDEIFEEVKDVDAEEQQKKIDEFVKLLFEQNKNLSAEAVEVEVNGEKIAAVKTTYSLNKESAVALVESIADSFGDDIQTEILDKFFTEYEEVYDDVTDEIYTEETSVSVEDIKTEIIDFINSLDSADIAVSMIVNEKTGKIIEVNANGSVKVAENDTDLVLAAKSDSDSFVVVLSGKVDGETGFIKAGVDTVTEGDVVTATAYVEVSDEEKIEAVVTYNTADGKFTAEYEAVKVSGTAKVDENSMTISLDGVEVEGENVLPITVTLKIKADVELPAEPTVEANIETEDDLLEYLATLDEDFLNMISSLFAPGYDDSFNDDFEGEWEDDSFDDDFEYNEGFYADEIYSIVLDECTVHFGGYTEDDGSFSATAFVDEEGLLIDGVFFLDENGEAQYVDLSIVDDVCTVSFSWGETDYDGTVVAVGDLAEAYKYAVSSYEIA